MTLIYVYMNLMVTINMHAPGCIWMGTLAGIGVWKMNPKHIARAQNSELFYIVIVCLFC